MKPADLKKRVTCLEAIAAYDNFSKTSRIIDDALAELARRYYARAAGLAPVPLPVEPFAPAPSCVYPEGRVSRFPQDERGWVPK